MSNYVKCSMYLYLLFFFPFLLHFPFLHFFSLFSSSESISLITRLIPNVWATVLIVFNVSAAFGVRSIVVTVPSSFGIVVYAIKFYLKKLLEMLSILSTYLFDSLMKRAIHVPGMYPTLHSTSFQWVWRQNMIQVMKIIILKIMWDK